MMQQAPSDRSARLRELAALFTRLGFTAFGGPAAHVALMEDQIVHRRQWMDRQHFLDLVAAVNFIPGPNSTELAIHIGQLRAGWRGLIVAGVCFICPAMLIVLLLAAFYVKFGSLPQMAPALRAIAAVIVAIIAFATFRFSGTAIKDRFTAMIVSLAVLINIAAIRFSNIQPELPILALAAIVGAIWYRSHARPTSARLFALALPVGFGEDLMRMGAVLLKIGATLFGSGYVLISYLQSDMVDQRHWLTQQQLVDAIAVGQFTPGPLLTTATFVGYLLGHTHFDGGTVGGVVGGVVATIAIFLPAFLLVAILGQALQKIRQNRLARGALDGMNAAVVGLMIVVTLRLAVATLSQSRGNTLAMSITLLLIGVSLVLLWRGINATWLIIAAGLVGAAVFPAIS